LNAGNRRFRIGTLVIAFTLLLAGVALAAAKSGPFKGTTTQTGQANGTVRFTVSKNHKIVQKFAGDIWSNCTKSGKSPQPIHINLEPSPAMAIRSSKFGFHGVFNISDGSVVIAKHVDGTISGKFVPGAGATGTMHFKWKFDSNAPAPFPGYNCSTGTVKYTAKHT
jgi:hypothetical protein